MTSPKTTQKPRTVKKAAEPEPEPEPQSDWEINEAQVAERTAEAVSAAKRSDSALRLANAGLPAEEV
jgi:hypothetical protein